MGEACPTEYLKACKQPGSVERLEYAASDHLHERSGKNDKAALVYLPHGYDPDDSDTNYNLLILMHGYAHDEEFLFQWQDGALRNLLDNMIERGDIPPLIVVTPTHLKNPEGHVSYSEEAGVLNPFTKEIRSDLIPALIDRYHLYVVEDSEDAEDAEGAAADDTETSAGASDDEAEETVLRPDREHWAIGGFSFGAVTTWYAFLFCLDLFKWFIPMYGDCWVAGIYGSLTKSMQTTSRLMAAVERAGLSPEDFCIHVTSGTYDPMYKSVGRLVSSMRARPQMFTADNLYYDAKQEGKHDYAEMLESLYNILPNCFQ